MATFEPGDRVTGNWGPSGPSEGTVVEFFEYNPERLILQDQFGNRVNIHSSQVQKLED